MQVDISVLAYLIFIILKSYEPRPDGSNVRSRTQESKIEIMVYFLLGSEVRF